MRGAVCDLHGKYPGVVKSCVATVELSNGDRENPADSYGSLVIHGDDQLLHIANDFQFFLHQRGAMNREMHETDGGRICIDIGIDRFQHCYEWMLYCMKVNYRRSASHSAP
jgi:hypothetical protein